MYTKVNWANTFFLLLSRHLLDSLIMWTMSDFVQNGEFSNPTAPKFVGRFYETENVETHPGTALGPTF